MRLVCRAAPTLPKSWPRLVAVLLYSVALLGIAPTAVAIDPARAVTQYFHDTWTTENGLPQNTVHSITQNSDGYLWLGMEEGLVRFDGVRFVVFDQKNTPTLRTKSVAWVVAGERGDLWLGSQGGGVAHGLDAAGTNYSVAQGLVSDIITRVFLDRQGRLWVGAARGLSLIAGGRVSTFTTQDGLSTDDAIPLAEDRDGAIWLGSRVGLNRWQDGKLTVYTTKNGLPSDIILAAHEDDHGRLWIGTRGGLAEWRDGRFTHHPLGNGAPSTAITAITGDRDGNLWLGTASGLLRWRDGAVDALGPDEGIGFVSSLYEDREGSLWIGTIGGGLHRLRDGKFIVYGTPEGLSHDAAYSAYEDRDGAVWISTFGGGLNRLTATTNTIFTTKNGLRSDSVGPVLGDRDGSLWISTHGGLHRLENGNIQFYSRENGLAESLVTALWQDRAGQIWVGNRDGLYRLDGDNFQSYALPDHLPDNPIIAIADSRDGSLWLGTYDIGLLHYKAGKWTQHTEAGLARQPVTCLYEDVEGTLWVGTFGGGLVRVRDERFTAFTTSEGLLDDNVLNILEDGRENLWMSSNHGIFRVSKHDLDELDRGERATINVAEYGKADGMRSAETNGGCMAVRHRDGRLWFPTAKGVVVVDPERLESNPVPPPVIVESLHANQQAIPLTEAIDLAPETSNLEIRYTGLSLIASEKVAFRYQLEGFDEDWVEAGTRRVAYYTNLAPGRYRFHVTARNNDGVWNEVGTYLGFSLRPRFYQTTWFVLLAGLATVLSAWGAHRVRFALAEAKTAVLDERNRIAREIHDGLTQELGGITMQLEVARDGIETASTLEEAQLSARNVARARGLTDGALEELHRSIWALRPALLEDLDLAEAVSLLIEQLDTGLGPEFNFTVTGIAVDLPLELERGVLRIAQEALFNATRHGHARNVAVCLHYAPTELRLEVEDDGCGFDQSSRTASQRLGFGLTGMDERVRKLGGTLQVDSASFAGTRVIALFPRPGRNLLKLLRSALRRLVFGRNAQ